MSYRDELEAARARITELEGRLEAVPPPTRDRFNWWPVYALLSGLITGVVISQIMSALTGTDEERHAISMLSERRTELTEQVAALDRQEFDTRQRLEDAQGDIETTLAWCRGQQQGPASTRPAATPPSTDPDVPRDPDWLTARLALCATGGTEEYPYAEGVVVRREAVLHQPTAPGYLEEVFVLRIPGQSEDLHFRVSSPAGAAEMRFWNRVEVGDVLGVVWRVRDGFRPIIRLSVTGKRP